MTKLYSIRKLFKGESLYETDKANIKEMMSYHRENPIIFYERSELEKNIFKKYIKDNNIFNFLDKYSESYYLISKDNLNKDEYKELTTFSLINQLIKKIEVEGDFKNKVVNLLNKIKYFKKSDNLTKKSILDVVINFGIGVISYNRR